MDTIITLNNNRLLKKEVAVIGASTFDVVADITEEHSNSRHRGKIKFMPGGKGFRTAIKLDELGLKSNFLSVIGDKFQSFIFEQELQKTDINYNLVMNEDVGSNIFFIATKAFSGAQSSIMDENIFTYDIDKQEIDKALENAWALVITFAMSVNNIRYAIEQANKRNITVIAVTCSITETKRADLNGLKIDYFIGRQDEFNVLLNKYNHKSFHSLAELFKASFLIMHNSSSCTVIGNTNQRTINADLIKTEEVNDFGYKDRFLAFFINQISLQNDVFASVANSLNSIVDSFESPVEKFTDLRNSVNSLTTRAKTDKLTGIINRESFYNALERMSKKEPVNSNEKTYIALLDIDFFKNVNDTYGHGIGDLVIRHVVKQINSTIRKDVVFARYGGEEFAIMANIKPENAEDFFNRIRLAVEINDFMENNLSINVTISTGYCLYNGNIESTINNADIALYKAKEQGRNNVQNYDVSFELLNCK